MIRLIHTNMYRIFSGISNSYIEITMAFEVLFFIDSVGLLFNIR